MKALVVAAILALTAQSALANQICSEDIKCEGLEFTWNPGQPFKVTVGTGFGGQEIDQLKADVCAVRHFCSGITVAEDGFSMQVPSEGLPVPAGFEDTLENRQQLSADCQAVIPSQMSNACYNNKVWQSEGLSYGN